MSFIWFLSQFCFFRYKPLRNSQLHFIIFKKPFHHLHQSTFITKLMKSNNMITVSLYKLNRCCLFLGYIAKFVEHWKEDGSAWGRFAGQDEDLTDERFMWWSHFDLRHERLSGGSGENLASGHIGDSVSDLRED